MEDVAKILRLYGKRRFRGPNPKLVVRGLILLSAVFGVMLAIPTTRALLFEGKASLELLVGNYAAAIDDLTIAVDTDPANVRILERRAQALEDSNETGRAIVDYENLGNVPSEKMTALAHLSQLYTKTADFARGEKCCEQWIQSAPNSGAAYHAKARLLEAEHKLDEARDTYDKSIALGGGLAATLDRDNLQQKMQYNNLDPIVNPALANKDNDYDALVQDALLLGSRNSPDATTNLEKAIKLNPNRPEAYDVRGVVRSIHKQYAAAIEDFQTANRLRRVEPASLKSKGAVMMSAQGLYRAGEISMWNGLAYARLHDYKSALKEFDKAVAFSPSPKMYTFRAAVYSKLGDKEKASADRAAARTAVDDYDVGKVYASLTDGD